MIDSDRKQLEELIGNVSRETFERMTAYTSLVRKWAPRLNLIGLSTFDDMWTRHVLDSAQLVRLAPEALQWVDLGPGAGFPGLVVAILLADKPDQWSVDLIESNRKKAVFLQIAAGDLGLASVSVHAERVEKALDSLRPKILTARALAPLSELLALASSKLANGATGLFHKGRDYEREVAEADSAWRFDMVKHPNRVLPDGVILEISNLRPRSEAG